MNVRQLGISMLATIGCLFATPVIAESDEQALVALMALLEQETELATRTRMNADYVPGMVTVLYGQDAREAGMRTVAEALSDVAGVFLVPTNSGDLRTIVRGIGATQNANNMKFLLDGVAVNRAVDGAGDWLLRMPLSQVERIEVIRGPGSAIHGGFAFSGVVNVIRRQGSVASVMAGSRELRQGDIIGQYHWQNGLNLGLNYSHWRQANSGFSTGLDSFPAAYSNSPGSVYDHEQGQLVMASLQLGEHLLSVEHASTERGPWFGRSGSLPSELAPRDETFTGIRMQSRWTVSRNLDVFGALSWQQTEVLEADFVPIPAGVPRPSGQSALENTRFIRSGSQDARQYASLGIQWQLARNHQLFMEAAYEYLKVEDASITATVPGQSSRKGPAGGANVLPGADRTVSSLTIQDQWGISSGLDLTLGLRHDSYSDHVAHTSPRIALLWRAADRHIFKAQYSEAFRPPTLSEANPGGLSPAVASPNLREEVINSAEMSYIYRSSDERMRVTLFNTLISDQIEFHLVPGQAPVWRNRSDIESNGIELEWQQRLVSDWQWRANLTWIEAQDFLDDDKQLLGSANLVGNGSLTWQPSGSLRHTVSVHGVGEREGYEEAAQRSAVEDRSEEQRPRTEQRDSYPSFLLFDYALHWRNVGDLHGFDVTLACLNIADTEYHSPATPNHFPDGLIQGRRTYRAGVSYSF